MAFKPHKFGRYIIVDPIAVGGMAEIYRARLAASKEGPDRVIVIKKVIANLSQNSEFLQMFEEEIKITVGLTHPNIIQIYDYGKNDDQYFMAMEYVEGKNLRQFVKRLADMKSMFSIDMSCHIISQVCHALAYAHDFKDRMSGKGLGIVHRDISPQNVMISYDGAVKLFDFGIAKAKSASEATRAGVIKGKPSYLSPEQINGEELDGRCDIFALGIVLWELLTAKRLFVAETDMGVLRLIQSAKIEPPSTFNPAVPQSLDAIVLKGLTRDKNKRYQSAEEFQRDLHKFLYSFNPSFNPADLSYYAQELFKSEIREDRERLQKFLAIDPIDDSKGESSTSDHTGTAANKNKLSNKLAEGLISTTDFNREMMDLVVQQKTGSYNKPSALELSSSSQMQQPKTVNVSVPGIGKPQSPGTTKSQSGNLPPPRRLGSQGDSMVIPPWSKPSATSGGNLMRPGRTQTALRREMDNSSDSSSGGRSLFILVGIVAVASIFVARQAGMLCGTPLEILSSSCFRTKPIRTPASPKDDKPVVVVADDGRGGGGQPIAPVVAPSGQTGLVVFKTKLTDYRVTVNSRLIFVQNNQFNVPINTPLNIEISKRGYETVRFQTELKSPSTAAYDLNPTQLPMGTVAFNTTPSANVIFWSGEERVFEGQTPVREQLPAGKYKVRIENSLLGIKEEMDITVEQGRLTPVDKMIGTSR